MSCFKKIFLFALSLIAVEFTMIQFLPFLHWPEEEFFLLAMLLPFVAVIFSCTLINGYKKMCKLYDHPFHQNRIYGFFNKFEVFVAVTFILSGTWILMQLLQSDTSSPYKLAFFYEENAVLAAVVSLYGGTRLSWVRMQMSINVKIPSEITTTQVLPEIITPTANDLQLLDGYATVLERISKASDEMNNDQLLAVLGIMKNFAGITFRENTPLAIAKLTEFVSSVKS